MKVQIILIFFIILFNVIMTDEIVNVKDIKVRQQQAFEEFGESHFDQINNYIMVINNAFLLQRSSKVNFLISRDFIIQLLVKCFEAGHSGTYVISTGRLFVTVGNATIAVRDVTEETTCPTTTCSESRYNQDTMIIDSLKDYYGKYKTFCYTQNLPCSKVWTYQSVDDFLENGPFDQIYGN